ncbi:MAG: hypothetical protein KDA22_06080 [Phycisphaerales bacterium]|nr:hypothetical protein [Phycisphaerales bacterium]
MRITAIASSIGAALLACASTNSDVVYVDSNDTLVAGAAELIDLDGNGTTDFQVYYGSASGWGSFVAVGPIQTFAGNGVGANYSGLYTTGYDNGDVFGPDEIIRLEPSLAIFKSNSGVVQGAWAAIGAEHYAGLRLLKDGQFHYGWLRLRNASGVTGMYILDHAYETTPDLPIMIGDGLPVAGDLDGDGLVDGVDLGLLLGAWGPCTSCAADLDGNGAVDGADLGLLLANWG